MIIIVGPIRNRKRRNALSSLKKTSMDYLLQKEARQTSIKERELDLEERKIKIEEGRLEIEKQRLEKEMQERSLRLQIDKDQFAMFVKDKEQLWKIINFQNDTITKSEKELEMYKAK